MSDGEKELYKTVGKLIKMERVGKDLTQEQLAKKANMGKSYISKIERGMVDLQLSTLHRLVETGLGKELSIKIDPGNHD